MTVNFRSIPFEKTERFPKIFLDYIKGAASLRNFYTYPPVIDSFEQAIADKKKESFSRDTLVAVLDKQYKEAGISSLAYQVLKEKNTFSVCTGHQLCIFTGPLYSIYKIITTINLARALQKKHPDHNFVPIYWMASEDHDFDEVSSINVFGKKVEWKPLSSTGAVGRLETSSLEDTLKELAEILGESENSKHLITLFSKAYLDHKNLATATRYLVHELFGKEGLVIIDGDDPQLKELFIEPMLEDIRTGVNYDFVHSSAEKLSELGYDIQVNPRKINLFRLSEGQRKRIESNTDDNLKLKPEEYSPNVVLRALYQQMILPNLAYIGGPGEIAYWLEYKSMFDYHKIAFPVLIPRNCAVISDVRTNLHLDKLHLDITDLFINHDLLIKNFINKNSELDLKLEDEKKQLEEIFSRMETKVKKIDPTLQATVEAELQKSLHSVKNIESKLLKAEKLKQETNLLQIKKLHEKFLPHEQLQERYENFSRYYLTEGPAFFEKLYQAFDPFKFEMLILNNE